ncbi:MAG: GTP-binding protein [Candidatus Heimdallarchaeota archaeon]|nr:GTP-binding protein [Candidatus Heimdallarchaeota archaeon]MCK5048739.1 GTP-binding protein [Candidatus Heimdallarchaeota archaeon]
MTSEDADIYLKIVLLGDAAVGKTSIRRRYLGQGFQVSHHATIGADFSATVREIDEYKMNFSIWDLAGQQTFESVRTMYYRGCFGGLILFDVTDESSFENLKGWIDELWKNSGRGKIPFILLGNKYDLAEEGKEIVSDEKINQFIEKLNQEAEENDFKITYLTTSAKTGLNVDEAFNILGRTIMKWVDSDKK